MENQENKPKKKITLAEKQRNLVTLKSALSIKLQQVSGQVDLLDEMQRNGVDLNSIEIDNTEGIL